jgi:NADH:ubiquinone oxidoreductase subunit E
MRRMLHAILFSMSLLLISASAAQGPDPKDEQELLLLVKEVQAQHLEIAANQTKLAAKLADVAEAIRVARIYTSRER